MRRDPWPEPGSITEAEVARRISVAVHSEHDAGSKEREKAVADAIAGTRELCAIECDLHFFAVYAAKAIRARGQKH